MICATALSLGRRDALPGLQDACWLNAGSGAVAPVEVRGTWSPALSRCTATGADGVRIRPLDQGFERPAALGSEQASGLGWRQWSSHDAIRPNAVFSGCLRPSLTMASRGGRRRATAKPLTARSHMAEMPSHTAHGECLHSGIPLQRWAERCLEWEACRFPKQYSQSSNATGRF